MTLDVLKLVHTNICRPFPMATWIVQHYFMTFMDDFSQYRYLYLLHEKLQSLDIFKNFKIKVENKLSKRTKSVRSDHGGEDYGMYDG